MGNSHTLLPLGQTNGEILSSCDTTLLSGSILSGSVTSAPTGKLVDVSGQTDQQERTNEATPHVHNPVRPRISSEPGPIQYKKYSHPSSGRMAHADNHFPSHHHPSYERNNITQMESDYQSPYMRSDFHGSPVHYSDQSTDGDSCVSETYKKLLKRDYLGRASITSTQSTPRRKAPSHSFNGYDKSDVPYTAAIDVNLDYTIHVGKLMIYLKQIRFNLSRVDEFLIDGYKMKGKIKCSLLSPAKGQRNSSNVFEASRRDRRVLYVDLQESFAYYLFPKNEIGTMALSFKIYACKKLFREFVLGETIVRLNDIDLNAEMLPLTITFGESNQLTAEKRTRSLQPVVLPKSEKLEILLSLQYVPEIAKLIVNVDQSTKLDELRYESKREIIVQAELVSPSCECVQRKTTFLKMSEDNPGSNKCFEFDLPQEDLLINTLMLSVSYSATRWIQQEKIGWIAFGRNCSGQVEAEHWDLMISKIATREAALQWHCLCESQDVSKSNTLLTRFSFK